MGKYVLFGKTVEFKDSAERYYDYQFSRWVVLAQAKDEFSQWYSDAGGIQDVLRGYQKEAASLVIKYANAPLFNQLTDFEIYDISEKTYDSNCLDLSDIDNAYSQIAQCYQDILNQQEAEKEYRAMRKDSRGRVVGGGFGLGGAVKGMATAGAINAASGLGHSVFNAIGNVGSAISASSQKSKLYENDETFRLLFSAIESSINYSFSSHLHLINDRIEGYYSSVFNTDKADALFNSAKKTPEKEESLLVEAFSYCPWNFMLYKYIFINFPNERTSILKIASRFNIDLSGTVEEILEKEYTPQAHDSDKLAIQARTKIIEIMSELGVTESKTLDQLETDCLNRLCSDYDSSDHSEKKAAFIEAFTTFEAKDEIKKTVVKNKKVWELAQQYEVEFSKDEIESIISNEYKEDDIMSEEAALAAKQNIITIMNSFGLSESKTFDRLEIDCLYRLCPGYENASEDDCKIFIEKVKAYDALDKNKEVVIKKLMSRIESIWSAEDGEIFDNILMETDITNDEAVKKAIQFIESKGRTESSKKYLEALNNCTASNIKKANMSQSIFAKILGGIGILILLLALLSFFVLKLGFWISAIIGIIGVIPIYYVSTLEEMWNKLTIDGKVINPAIKRKK